MKETKSGSISAFALVMWLFVIIAFLQLMAFGIGISSKLKADPIVQIVEVPVVQKVSSPAISVPSEVPAQKAFTIPQLPDLPPLPEGLLRSQQFRAGEREASFLFDPPVQSPLSERLLKEALHTRVLGDMRATALKLDEILEQDQENVHAIYLFAELYETMGVFDKALRYYERVFAFGSIQAGALYKKAGSKLQNGFGTTTQEERLLAIGIVNQFVDSRVETGDQVSLTIPILSSPRAVVDASQVEVTVSFFDRVGDQVVPALPSNKAECFWKDEEVNWLVNGEEILLTEYYLPEVSEDQLLGPRRYYGFSIELSYKGEYVDQYAWPRILARQIESHPDTDFLSFPFEDSEIGINPDNMLLPILENQ